MKNEINLLPDKFQKARTRHLYLAQAGRVLRRIYLGLGLIIMAELALWGYFSVELTQIKAGEVELDGLGAEAVAQAKEINAIMQSFNEVVQKQITWTDLISVVLAELPDDIVLTKMQVESDAQAIEINGVSSSRGAVVALQQQLQEREEFSEVEAPLKNFTVDAETDFSLLLKREVGP